MINEKRRKITFKLIIPRYRVKKHTGNSEPESSLSPRFPESSDKMMEGNLTNKEMSGANISNNIRYKKSPSVVSRIAKISSKSCNIES